MKAEKLWRAESTAARADHDFFPTDAAITAAFMAAELPRLMRMGITTIEEPACGDGAMAAVLRGFNFGVVASDIADRGYGHSGVDFLKQKHRRARAMVTNPPYKDQGAEKFLRHAHGLGFDYAAMLLKVQFWNPQEKVALWRDHRPAREYKVCWRPDFLGLGGGMLDVCFWVWDFTRVARRTEVFLLTKDGECV